MIFSIIAGSAVTAIVNNAAERELLPDSHISTGLWSVLGGVIGAITWWQISK